LSVAALRRPEYAFGYNLPEQPPPRLTKAVAMLSNAIAVMILLIVIGGTICHELDTKEFPDEDLPGWFVRWFRDGKK
jgi:hypothetical protein